MKNQNGIRVPSCAKPSQTNAKETARPKPWQHPDGSSLSEGELRTVSQYWNRETWEAYLALFETKQREYLPPNYERILYASDQRLSLEGYLYGSDENFVTREVITSPQLQTALLSLTERQRQVIRAIFFDSLTQAEVARMIEVSPRRVGYLARRAIRQLRRKLAPQLMHRK